MSSWLCLCLFYVLWSLSNIYSLKPPLSLVVKIDHPIARGGKSPPQFQSRLSPLAASLLCCSSYYYLAPKSNSKMRGGQDKLPPDQGNIIYHPKIFSFLHDYSLHEVSGIKQKLPKFMMAESSHIFFSIGGMLSSGLHYLLVGGASKITIEFLLCWCCISSCLSFLNDSYVDNLHLCSLCWLHYSFSAVLVWLLSLSIIIQLFWWPNG